MVRLSFLSLCALWMFPSALKATPCLVPNSVGYRIATYDSLKVGVWYPTSAKEASYYYFTNLAGSAAFNAAPGDCGLLPLLIFSHAYGGCGTQSVFFTEELARRGYIVAAPDHRDALCSVDGTGSQTLAPSQESFLDPASWTDATYLDRRQDIETTIAGLLKDPALGPRIDIGKIAVSGHSLGGYTAFGLGGGWPSWKDERIKAVLLFSPYILPFQLRNMISGMTLPVMYQGAQFDIGITPFLVGPSGAFALSRPPKFFPELTGGTHFDWTVLVCGSATTIAGCLENSSNARTINSYAFAFLDHFLMGASTPVLFSNGAGLAAYQRTTLLTAVSAASLQPGAAPSSIVSGFGEGLATMPGSAAGATLPSSLAGISAVLVDSRSASRDLPLYFVSPSQVNFLIPPGTASGTASVSLKLAGQEIASGTFAVSPVAPALFAANGGGTGIAAAQFVTLTTGGKQRVDLAFDPATLAPVPLILDASQPTYLVLYGTGLRGKQTSVALTVGGVAIPVTSLAAQSQYAGLDQVNAGPLPKSLTGRGVVEVRLTVDGQATNSVSVVLH